MAQSAVESKPLLSESSEPTTPTLKQHLQQTLKQSSNATTNDTYDEKTTASPSGEIGKSNKNNNNDNNNQITYRDFFTEYGRQRVTIEGDISSGKPVIMTYHDIGINHVGCFQSFFSIVSTYPNILRYFVIVHIDAPGHHYDTIQTDMSNNMNNNESKTTDDNDNTNNSNNTRKTKHTTITKGKDYNESKITSFSLTKLGSFIETIVYELKIKRFFGFGVGAGCNVWLEYSRHNNTNDFDNNKLRGLILINPTNIDASWSEWGVNKMFSYIGSNTEWLKNVFFGSMIPRYSGWEPISEDSREFLLNEINKIDEDFAVKYFRGYTERVALTKSQLRKINCRCLILASEESKVFQKTLELQSDLPNNLIDFVKFDHGSFLMTESHPQLLIKPIQLFVQSMGVSQLTMEMKYGKITE